MKDLLKLLFVCIDAKSITNAQKEEAKKSFESLGEESKKECEKEYNEAMSIKTVEEVEAEKEEEGEEAKEGEELKKMVNDKISKSVKKEAELVAENLTKSMHEAIAKAVAKADKNSSENKVEKAKSLNVEFRTAVKEGLKKAYNETTDADGGYLCGEELNAEIGVLTTQYGVARRVCNVINMTKKTYKKNELATDMAVYWVDEQAKITVYHITIAQKELEAKKLAVISTITNELMQDEEFDLMRFTGARVAEKLSEKEDDTLFNGDGTSASGGFTGVLNSSAIVNEVTMTSSTITDITGDDFLDMIDATPSGALVDAKFYFHRTIMSLVRKLEGSDGHYIYQHPSERGPQTLWGYPIETPEVMPTQTGVSAGEAFVVFGSFKKGYIMGLNGSLQVSQSGSASLITQAGTDNLEIKSMFQEDKVAVRWTERIGFVQVLTSNANMYPLTVLILGSESV